MQEGSAGGFTGSFGGTANYRAPSSSHPERETGNRRSHTVSRATLSVRLPCQAADSQWSAEASLSRSHLTSISRHLQDCSKRLDAVNGKVHAL